MTEFEKRIKLAEAMGLGFEEAAHGWRDSFRIDEAEAYEKELPNPYKDASHDYSVLEWMRNEGKGRYDDFCNALAIILDNDHFNYKIGYYARAALKVIE